ncbi:hypothetical protein CKM354_000089000 [Cercospora kikuchii]|uniref:NAD(P)-binding domain-containing protein n=1 Tax=Cercospora kikuchii TaxID=84275 RepID=A0A9P3C6R2_9PEZI|nr:uncharacterized protein CKM354_000089000 [Cercospora kikuchii]GIZ37444.1 hypothetical protein CKM354_000089000 [Cercospora kikuchii]
MHFLVLGATGPCGITFLETALQSGQHDLTIYARNPSKLPQHIQSLALSPDASPKVHIIKGEFSSNDTPALKQALSTGAKTLVSFAGPGVPSTAGTPITDWYRQTLYPLILSEESCQIERVLILSTPSFKVQEDKFSIKWWFGVQFVYWLFGDAYKEVVGIGNVTSNGPLVSAKPRGDRGKEVEWTVFRVPGLRNGKQADAVRAGWVGEKGDGLLLSRKSLAVWILQEVEERKWVGKSPALSDAGAWI